MMDIETQLRTVLAREPGNADARIALGSLLLRRGDFKAGWEYLYPSASRPKYLPPPNDQAPWLWRGESLAGKTILIYPDEGFGDMIQWYPLVSRLAGSGAASVIFQVPRALKRIFAHCAPSNVRILTWEEQPDHKEGYGADFYCAVSHLPGVLSVNAASLPLARSYLAAPNDGVSVWEARLRTHLPRVGLVWQGNPKHPRDQLRSMPLELMKRMLIPDVAFYSLQMGAAADALHPIVDCARYLTDFQDTAACLQCLDAVLTVDTAVAHLSCALGLQTIILIDARGDWRWGEGRQTSWYPTARLIRQRNIGNWDDVFGDVSLALHEIKSAGQKASKLAV